MRRFLGFALLVASACSHTQATQVAAPAAAPPTAGAAAPAGPSGDRLDASSAQAFTASVAARLHREGFDVRIKSELTLGILFQGADLQLNLDRVFGVCVNDPPSCEPGLAEIVDRLHTALRVAPVEASMLRVAVRRRDYVDYLTSQAGAAGAAWLASPPVAVGGDLEAILMIDEPDRARPAQAGDLEGLALDPAGARARAEANTRDLVGKVVDRVKAIGDDEVGALGPASYYESSLLLDTAGWAEVAKRQPGTLVASVPAADLLLYKWITKPEQAAAFATITEQAARTAHTPLSATVLKWNGGGWEPLR
jgi:hypothetical protein